jgi:hypothetical protein
MKSLSRRKVLAVGLLGLVVIAVARETGILDASLYWLQLEGTYSGQAVSTLYFTGDHGDDRIQQTTTSFDGTIRSKSRLHSLAVNGGVAKADEERDGTAKPGEIVITDVETDLQGWYWLPMEKTGECAYSAKFVGKSAKGAVVRGKIHGKVNVRAVGLCSARTFGENAVEAIKDLALQDIRRRFAE